MTVLEEQHHAYLSPSDGPLGSILPGGWLPRPTDRCPFTRPRVGLGARGSPSTGRPQGQVMRAGH